MGRINTKLFLEDYKVDVNIGIHDFEKKGPQRILINIEIVIDVLVLVRFKARALSNNFREVFC